MTGVSSQPRPRHALDLLPSLLTLLNMLCGFAAVLSSIDGADGRAAVLVGVAIVLDIADGAVARLVGCVSPFGLQFDSLADLVSFGVAPAVIAFGWGLSDLGLLGWVACAGWLSAAAIRLARFTTTTDPAADKRFFAGLPSPGAAGLLAATVYAFPGPQSGWGAVGALLVLLVPAVLMVSTVGYRSFRSLVAPAAGRRWQSLAIAALAVAGFGWFPGLTACLIGYTYLCSPVLFALLRGGRAPRVRIA